MVCPPLSKDEYYPVFLVAILLAGAEGEGGGGQLVTTDWDCAVTRNIDVELIRIFS